MNAYIRSEIYLDQHDAFGSIASWGFACADALYREGDGPPHEWDYHPGIGAGQRPTRGDDPEGWRLAVLLRAGRITLADIEHAGNVIMRYWRILETQGRTY